MTLNHLILVEGLTGSGKSNAAHFIARQINRQKIPSSWLHEGEIQHPVLQNIEESSNEDLIQTIQSNWSRFLTSRIHTQEIIILEASFFNNLFESLFIRNIPLQKIITLHTELSNQAMPLNPALVYLDSGNVQQALDKNFRNRGESFKNFVIDFVMNTSYAKKHQLSGTAGCYQFWEGFVALTDKLYDQSKFKKIKLDVLNTSWKQNEELATDFLGIPYTPDMQLSSHLLLPYTGKYKDNTSSRDFEVKYQHGILQTNWIHNTFTRLIPVELDQFQAAGWHFTLHFKRSSSGQIQEIQIDGKDIDYLQLVGRKAFRRGSG
ncbi:MAG: hypothetical protein JEZ06_01605 [Anaerolineaceae bacterium]|nr:hypothetical protein [Anaerolineaceae bacterium]